MTSASKLQETRLLGRDMNNSSSMQDRKCSVKADMALLCLIPRIYRNKKLLFSGTRKKIVSSALTQGLPIRKKQGILGSSWAL